MWLAFLFDVSTTCASTVPDAKFRGRLSNPWDTPLLGSSSFLRGAMSAADSVYAQFSELNRYAPE